MVGDTTDNRAVRRSQRFTTGAHAGGYTLERVETDMSVDENDTYSAAIYTRAGTSAARSPPPTPIDSLTYTLGADAASFAIVEASGQIQTRSGVTYDHEAKSTCSVTVTASDGDATATATVTISLNDVDEPPARLDPPRVASVDGSTARLEARWYIRPIDDRPAVTGYVNYIVETVEGEDAEFELERSGPPATDELSMDTSSGAVRSRLWDFGDGVRTRNRRFEHAWSEPGFYEVTLSVSDGTNESTAARSRERCGNT